MSEQEATPMHATLELRQLIRCLESVRAVYISGAPVLKELMDERPQHGLWLTMLRAGALYSNPGGDIAAGIAQIDALLSYLDRTAAALQMFHGTAMSVKALLSEYEVEA